MKDNRDYRNADEAELKEDYIIEGYATTFDKYKLFEQDGLEYFEQIDRNAFKDTDFSDVIFQLNHKDAVFARNSNGSLRLEIDDKGLKVIADLSRTKRSRDIYEEIKEKMLVEMSFAFSVKADNYDSETRTRSIASIKKVYDVSVVDRGANSYTSISARSASSYVEGVSIEQSRIELQKARTAYKYNLALARAKGNEDYGN